MAIARGFRSAHASLGARTDDAELVVRVRLAGASAVDGDVRDVDGKPVQARVVACEGQPAEARVVSGDDGAFQLPPATIGCDAVAEHDDYAPSDPASVVEGRRLSLQLKAGGSIEGAVVDDRGAGVPAFDVGIETYTTPRGQALRRGGRRHVDDAGGAFRWDKLAPGTYVLTASAAGKPPARSDPVDVTAGKPTRGVRIVLLQGGTSEGRVSDEGRAPLAGVELRFDSVSSVVDSTPSAKTDDAGFYRLEGAPSGPFTLRAQKDGYRMRMISGLRVGSRGTVTQDITLAAIDGGATFEFGGIGASLDATHEGIAFGGIFPGNPADRAGLRQGDRIERIDGDDASTLSVADVLQRLRGQAGTTVSVAVVRPSTGERLEVYVERASIVR